MNEIYKPIPNYEGLYEVSNLCNVKSLPKTVVRGKYNVARKLREKVLKATNGDVTLCKNGTKKTFDVQTLYKIVFENFEPDGKRKINLIENNGKILKVKRRQVCQIIKSLKPRKRSLTGVGRSGLKFRADICINGIDVYLGTFNTEVEAHKMYNIACENESDYKGDAHDFRIKLNSIFASCHNPTK